MHDNLIKKLREESRYKDKATLEIMDLCMEAAQAIESLTAENAAKDAEIKRLKLELQYKQDECDHHYGDVCEAKADLARVEEERDAAMEEVPHTCYTCEKRHGWDTCKEAAYIEDGSLCLNWKWRGPQKESD